MEVDEDQVADFGHYLGAEASSTLPRIEQFARDEGMSADGFMGVLEPLGEIINGEASVLVGEGFGLMQQKLCELGDGVIAAAQHYGYNEEVNQSLFELNGLSDSEDPDYGTGYDPYVDPERNPPNTRHTEEGSSNFHYTETELDAPDREDAKFSDRVDDTGVVLDVVNWIWSEFNVDEGKEFTDSILEPLVGNPSSIEANGKAWETVGTNFGLLASNMLTNAGTLLSNHWGGEAANQFNEFLSTYWEKGAVWAGEQLGGFVAKGFDKIAEVSTYLAGLAIDAINLLIKVARRIATKAIPVVGWAWTAIEAAASAAGSVVGAVGGWFGQDWDIDIDALWDDIQEIISLAQTCFDLYENMRQLVETMEEYFNSAQELIDTVAQIPEIGSLADAAATASTINETAGDMEDQTAQMEENLSGVEESLDELDEISENAEGAESS